MLPSGIAVTDRDPTCALMDVQGRARMSQRVAIVTGGARGIGAAISARLAADGFAVGVIDLDEAACAGTVERFTGAGGRALAVGANVADPAAVQAGVERIASE